MKRTIHFLIGLAVILVLPTDIYGQSWKKAKADTLYNRLAYAKAIPIYESIKDKDSDVYRKLGESYYVLRDYEKSSENYRKLIETGDYRPEDLYRYAFILKYLGNYEESKRWMEEFSKRKPQDSRAKRFMEDPDYYVDLLEQISGLELNNVSINSKYEDFGPVFYKGDEVVFASNRRAYLLGTRKWSGNDQPYLDLYKSKVSNKTDLEKAELFYDNVNAQYHDGPATFNGDGTYMVVTRNIYGKKVEDNRLWLYESTYEEGKGWSEAKPLPFNSDAYNTGHGALTSDGKKLYFVSDRPGGMGGTDIYVVKRQSDGSWGEPKNLGPSVNTEGNEMFPYYEDKTGHLFYASDGLPGLGGLDLFVVQTKDDDTRFSKVYNLGVPINSRYDDFAITYREDGSGYFSSNRAGGKGDDDIYGFSGLKQKVDDVGLTLLRGVVKDADTGEPLSGAKLRIYDKDGKLLKEITTDEKGSYSTYVDIDKDLTIKVVKDEYNPGEEMVMKVEMRGKEVVEKDVPIARSIPAYCKIKLPVIYYDLDKFDIRKDAVDELEEIVRLMQQYPEIRLEVSSHTDSRATEEYNIRLSKNRAEAVAKYLEERGISRDRLVLRWYGEKYPVNGCVDGVECSEEQHQLNRRSEFRILDCPSEVEWKDDDMQGGDKKE